MDDTNNLVRALAFGVRDLAEPQRFMTLEERQQLWDMRHNLTRILDADLLLRLRPLPEGSQERPRVYLDVFDVPQVGGGVPQPNNTGLEPPTVHALQKH